MLLDAAAQKWGVAKSQLRTENGQVINTVTNARLSYGSLADAAGKLPVPAKVAVKDPKDFHLIGTSPKRLDTPLKVNGTAGFGIDARRPGMVYAVVARCPSSAESSQLRRHESQGRSRRQQVVRISRGVASSPTTPGPPWKAGARCSFSLTRARTPISTARAFASCS
jgi:isoquinoline 1-oxidoreductase beta subunit